MFTQTEPKEVLLRDTHRALASASAEGVAGIAHNVGSVAHTKVSSGPPRGLHGGSTALGGGALPPIQLKRATASDTVAAPHARNERQPSGRQKPPQDSVTYGQVAPVVLPAMGDVLGERSSATHGTVVVMNSGNKAPMSSQAEAPAQPVSAGRAAAPHRRNQASPAQQPRRLSAGRKVLSPNSARAGGSPGRRGGRRLSSQAQRRKGLKSLKQQVESAEAALGQLMQAGSIGEALALLSSTLRSVQDFYVASTIGSSRGSALASTAPAHAVSAATKSSAPGAAWATETVQRLAEVYTTVANNAGVWCNAAAGPIHVQEACFQSAMRYIVKDSTENLFPEWTTDRAVTANEGRSAHPPKQQRSPHRPGRSATQSPSRSFSCFPVSRPTKGKGNDPKQSREPAIVRRLLRCAVRTNAVVCLGDAATPGGQARVIYELLKALTESDGVWSMTVLYNLAVAFLGIGSYDDAAEAIARFMEVSLHYLNWAQSFEKTAGSGDDASAVAAAVQMHAALQLIRGHHFIAAMAAWCEPHGPMELYHCELASACAERYLNHSDRAQRDCQCRLAAAQTRAATGTEIRRAKVKDASDEPPPFLLLPYITQDLILPLPSSVRTTAADGDASTIVTMHVLVEALVTSSSLSASLPAEVRAYVQEVQKGASLRYWARAAMLAGASPPFLSAAVAASTAQQPVPSALMVLLNHGDNEEGVWAHQSWMKSPICGAALGGDLNPLQGEVFGAASTGPSRASVMAATPSSRFTPGRPAGGSAFLVNTAAPTPLRTPSGSMCGTSPLKPSKSAPLFVTSVPSSAYGRYRKLRDDIVAQVENAEQMEEQAADVNNAASPLVTETLDESATHPETPNSRLGTASTCPSTERLPSRSGRVTALLVGASSAATPLRGPVSRERLCGDAVAAFGLREEEALEYHGVRSTTTTAALDSTTLLALPVRPSELLRKLDWETEMRYSRLVEDTLADLHRVASTCIQAWWRMHLARQERLRRASNVNIRLRQERAAICVQVGYRHWKERAPARAELQRLRAHRERVRCVAVLQAFVRQRASVEAWGRLCLAWCKLLVLQREVEARRAAAAVTLQSWWRMHMARRQLCERVAAAIRLQCAWRCRLARHELRSRRVHRRLALEQWRHERLPQIIYVQRWWRACCSRWAVGDLLYRKQRSVEECLTAQESHYEEVMRTHLRSVENVEAAMRCVLAVLAGARDRRQIAQLFTHARVRQRTVHRFVLLWCGRQQLQQLRHDRTAALALMRRREEVAVAVVTLQSWVRSWLPHRLDVRQRAHTANLNAHAQKIQTAFRHHRVRQALVNGRAQRCRLEVARRRAEVQNDAAARIQSVWRMYRTQRELFDLFQFMLRDRHKYATAVQRRWRGHHARAVLAPQRGAHVTNREVSLQNRAAPPCAAVRLQSFYRMYRTRIQLLRLGVRLLPTLMYRIAAARRIQTSWRAYAAYQRVLRLRLQRSYILKQAHSQEALHAYATRIQAVARSYLVRCSRLLRSEPTLEQPPAAVTAATKALVPHPPSNPRV
ncbi:hypothetical protein JKF63_03689 [Porcisia hertigi]|uniref:Uncharacterized protein n=1 Tax=Porcisia hertigi TaxID=2761500 RepID=A0A836HWT4_9TRYP|nr:hypothetical protein JKF63_03689 [Porcisia hertigi]